MATIYGITKLADDAREAAKQPKWSETFARYISVEETRLMNPRKSLEVLAHANGHQVIVSNDVLPLATRQAIRSFLREIKEHNVTYKSAVLAGSISVEGASRIQARETTLTEERLKADRWTPIALRSRMKEIEQLNESIGETAMAQAKTPKQKQKIRTDLDNLNFISADDALEYEALNLLSVYGRDVVRDSDVKWKSAGLKERVTALVSMRVSSDEYFLPDVDEAEVERLKRSKRLDEREMLMLEKARVMELGYLNSELRADGSDLTAEEWVSTALSYIPHFLDKRFLLSVSEPLISKFNKQIVAELPQELTEGRSERAVGLMKAAACLTHEGISSDIKRFEKASLISAGDTHIQFVSNALGVDEDDACLDVLRIKKGLTKRDAYEFLTAAYKKGSRAYPEMRLMTSDDAWLIELAEQIYAKRAELSLLIPSVVKPIRKSDGRGNEFQYLSQVFAEIGLGNLVKLGKIKQQGKEISVIALVRKEDLLEPAEGYAYTLRRWENLLKQVAEREKFLAVTDF